MAKRENKTKNWADFKANQEKFERLNEIYDKLEFCEDSLEGRIVEKPVALNKLDVEINGKDINLISALQAIKEVIYNEMNWRRRENIKLSKQM